MTTTQQRIVCAVMVLVTVLCVLGFFALCHALFGVTGDVVAALILSYFVAMMCSLG